MKAMILAAGLGKRMQPLTLSKPKALIEVAGKPLLEHVIGRLRQHGVTEIIINVHHFAQQIIDFVQQQRYPGLRIEFSVEEELLDTGGGLQKAAWFFNDGEPFILHNVDVLSDLNLAEMVETHRRTHALVTLAVRKRRTSRYLLFDAKGELAGWESTATGEKILLQPTAKSLERLSFMGIHVISPLIFPLLDDKPPFPILPAYLRLAETGQRILSYRGDTARWLDLGRPENLARVERTFPEHFFC